MKRTYEGAFEKPNHNDNIDNNIDNINDNLTNQPSTSSPHEEQHKQPKLDLISMFKTIEATISVQIRNGHIPTWDAIKESFANMSGIELTIDSFDPIVWYARDLYSIGWKDVPTMKPSKQLCIEIAALNSASDNARNSKSFFSTETISSRLGVFRKSLARNDYDPSDVTWFERCRLNDLTTTLPSSCDATHAIEVIKSELPKANSVDGLNSMSCSTIGTTNQVEVQGLEKLRAESILRGQQQVSRSRWQERERLRTIEIKRTSTLSTLLDILRSNALISNRISRPLRELSAPLAKDLRISEIELLQRIQVLSEVVPEFVSIISPDDIVTVTTLRLNMDAVYDHVRAKVHNYARSRISDLRHESEADPDAPK